MRHAWALPQQTLEFAQPRRNDPEMRYLSASAGRLDRYQEDAARLTVYRRHPTLCAVMLPNLLFPT